MIEHLSKAFPALLVSLTWIPAASALDIKRPEVRIFAQFVEATSRLNSLRSCSNFRSS